MTKENPKPKSIICELSQEELKYKKLLKDWVRGKNKTTKKDVIKAMPSQSI